MTLVPTGGENFVNEMAAQVQNMKLGEATTKLEVARYQWKPALFARKKQMK